LAPSIRRRKLSCLELTRFVLERITLLQPAINAYITVTADIALAQAKEADEEIARGRYRGVLHGIPISIKDLFHMRGTRTTAGSRILKRHVPKENSLAVERLLEAGCIFLGKTNLHEFAYGATNVNPHFGPVRNPWNTNRISGGSSGGSAASVISAQAIASLGTDTGGSIRIPSAACGCVGLKPTYGRVPLNGVIPLAPTLDHAGPLCRCVADAAHMFEALAGPGVSVISGSGSTSVRRIQQGVKGLRIGVPRQYFFDRIQRDVRHSVLTAIGVLEQLGATIHETELKGMGETADLASNITAGEALSFHWKWLLRKPQSYGRDVRSRLQQSRRLTALAYLRAQQGRCAYTERLIHALEHTSVLAVPTLPVVAPRVDRGKARLGGLAEDLRLALLRLTRPANLAGLPAISLPCGFSSEGMPIGLQLIGKPFDEATVLRVAYAYERATSWHKLLPSEAIQTVMKHSAGGRRKPQ